MKIVNPWNGAKIAEVTTDDARSVAAKVRQARAAQPRWAAVPIRKRLETIARFRERVVALEETLARHYLAGLRAHGCTLAEAEIRQLLELDIVLNAEGSLVWRRRMDDAARRAKEKA